MGNGIDGNGKRARGPSSARRAQLAESRQCPRCNRGAALSNYDDGLLIGVACRWCDYTHLREHEWAQRIAADLPSPTSGTAPTTDPTDARVEGTNGSLTGGDNR